MIKRCRILVLALATVMTASVSTARAASDPYTCLRAKDLKTGSVEFSPNPAFTGLSQGGGSGDCTLRKISLVCLPSSINAQIPLNTADAQCCYRSKCDHSIGDLPNVAIADEASGAGTFSTNVSLSRATLTCVPCSFTPQ